MTLVSSSRCSRFKMSFDCRGNKRGRCLDCFDCKEFTPWGKNIRCAYCDCPPTKHECFAGHELTATGNNASSPSQVEDDEHQEKTHLQQHSIAILPSANENSFTAALPNDNLAGSLQSEEKSVTPNGGIGKPLTKHLNCPICKKKFSKVANLKGHILLHKGKRQLKCNKCPKSFLDINELMNHKKTHKNDISGHQVSTEHQHERGEPKSTTTSVEPQPKKKKPKSKATVVPKHASVPSYQPGINLWSPSNQSTFLMSPLTGGLFPQVTMPAQMLPPNAINATTRVIHSSPQTHTTQAHVPIDGQSSHNQKILNLLQSIDAKVNALSQVDRKLDYVIHSLNMPRQSVQDVPQFSVETDQVARSYEQISPQVEESGQTTRMLIEPLEEKMPFKRGGISPGQPIPDYAVDEAFHASVSRRNLAKNLVFMVFTPEELRGRNCSGKVYGKGTPKERLNQLKLQAVKLATFRKYPCDPSEMDLIWQRECIKAIDKAIRSRALGNKL